MGIFDRISKEIEAREAGIKVSDLLALPAPLRTLMNRVMRDKEITVAGAAAHLHEPPATAQQMLDALVEKGYLLCEKRQDALIYTVRYGRTNPREVPGSLWAALGEKIDE